MAYSGPWMLSFCDTHAPTASVAKSVFFTMFPTESKRQDAATFCQEELVRYVSDMLFTATPDSLSDPG